MARSTARQDSKELVWIAFLSSFLTSPSLAQSVAEFEKSFGEAKDLAVINRLVDLPADAQSMLETQLHGRPMAEFGAAWAKTDAIPVGGRPSAQHLFTAASDTLMVVLYQVGGHDAGVRMLLAPRNAETYCRYNLGKWELNGMDLRTIQSFFKVGSPEGPRPKCEKVQRKDR